MPFSYQAFGLAIESDSPILGLARAPANLCPDVQVHTLNVPPWLTALLQDAGAQPWRASAYRTSEGVPIAKIWKLRANAGDYFWLRYQSGNEFVIDGRARNIWAVAEASQKPPVASAYLLGPLLGLALRLRGYMCLHASAVAVSGQAVVFMGPPHAGKSTTAAMFVRAGYPLVADDVVAFKERDAGILVQPTYAGLRLWLDAAQMLHDHAEELPRVMPGDDKRYVELRTPEERFHTQPLPLGAIYYLADRRARGAEPSIERGSARESLMWLVANTYLSYISETVQRADEFKMLGRLVARVPVRRVVAADDPSQLAGLRDAILRDCEHSLPLAP